MINWVADKPWEFAYDPSRQSFLATEAVNFTRNVLTAVPAEEPVSHPARPLRILVVVAQPIGLGLLSAEEVSVAAKKGTKMAAKWSPARGAVGSEPFPLLRGVVRNGPELS